jgi:hypothetical protein
VAYTTASLLKTYLGIAVSTDDTLLTALIARAQAAIDAYCGRTFEASGNTTRYFDVSRDVTGRTLRFDTDCCSINSVTNGDATAVAAASYVTEPRNQTPYWGITLLASTGLSWTFTSNAENAIAVSAKWAYSASAPDDIVHATLRLAAYYYRQKDAQVFDVTADPALGVMTVPVGMPADVRMILGRYRRLM